MTTRSDILLKNHGVRVLKGGNGASIRLPLIDHDMYLYLHSRMFKDDANAMEMTATNMQRSWKEICKKADNVNHHVCGYLSLSDMLTLMERNGILKDDDKKYLTGDVTEYHACRAAERLGPSRKVTPNENEMIRIFNTLCVYRSRFSQWRTRFPCFRCTFLIFNGSLR